jgi:hypothetical protein
MDAKIKCCSIKKYFSSRRYKLADACSAQGIFFKFKKIGRIFFITLGLLFLGCIPGICFTFIMVIFLFKK